MADRVELVPRGEHWRESVPFLLVSSLDALTATAAAKLEIEQLFGGGGVQWGHSIVLPNYREAFTAGIADLIIRKNNSGIELRDIPEFKCNRDHGEGGVPIVFAKSYERILPPRPVYPS